MFWSHFESKEQARTLSSSTCHLRPGAAFGQGKATWAKFAKGALAKWTCPCDRISCRLSTWKSLNHSNSQRNLKALTGQRSNSSKLFFSTPHRFIGFPKRCGEINVDCWSYLASKGDRCEAGYCRTFSWMKKSNLGKLINSCWKDQQQNYVSHNTEQQKIAWTRQPYSKSCCQREGAVGPSYPWARHRGIAVWQDSTCPPVSQA